MNAAALSSLPLAKRLSLLVLLTLAVLVAPARADDDPPARAGRVSEVSGEAWLFDAEDKEWVQVERNQTIGEGDRLRTDGRSRLTLRIGSTSLWLDEGSDLEFSRLDDGRVELRLDKGSLALRLRNREELNDYQLITREGRFTAEREGLYRIDQLDRGSRALNWEGSLRFDSRGPDVAPVWLGANEQAEYWWGNGARTERQRLERDEFADWLLAQKESEGQSLAAYRYVSPEMTGAEELDRYGRWEQSSEYGPLWAPAAVAVDWAPYRYGRWGWTRAWGWTWIDAAPWGFAPFHYGRWVHYGGRWCWAPGAYSPRPVYAPALVAWVGGPAVSVGINIGSRPPPPRYGWYPLAPREAYVPGYRHSPTYWQRINRDNGHGRHDGMPGPHRNRDVAGAISVMPGAGGRPAPFRPSEVGPLRPVSQAPGRGDLPQVQPPRVRPQPAPGFERPDRPERPGRGADRPDRIEPRPERAERNEPRPERPDRQEWSTRPGRPFPQAVDQGPPRPGFVGRQPEQVQQQQPQRPSREQMQQHQQQQQPRPMPMPERAIEAPRPAEPARVGPPSPPRPPEAVAPRPQPAAPRAEEPRRPEPRPFVNPNRGGDDNDQRRGGGGRQQER
jgi:hypothetical protein